MKKEPKPFTNRTAKKWTNWITSHGSTYVLAAAWFLPYVPHWVFIGAVTFTMALVVVEAFTMMLLHFIVNHGLLVAERVENPETKPWIAFDYFTDVLIVYILAAAGFPFFSGAYILAAIYKFTEPTLRFTPIALKKIENVEG